MAVPLQQPNGAAGYNNSADADDLDFVKGATDESDVDAGYANGDADITSATTPSEVEPFHYILSLATGMFVAITKSGRVQAHAQMGKYTCSHVLSDQLHAGGNQNIAAGFCLHFRHTNGPTSAREGMPVTYYMFFGYLSRDNCVMQ